MRDGDLVTLATTSGNAWWSARVPDGREDLLAVLARARGRIVDASALDRMSDYEAFWIALHEDSTTSAGTITARVVERWEATGACPVEPRQRLDRLLSEQVRGRATQLDGMRRRACVPPWPRVRRAIEALAPVRGRKSLLLVSEGFLEDFGGDTRAVAALSREANTAVYFVDVRGLEALPGGLGSAAAAGPPPAGRERFEAATSSRPGPWPSPTTRAASRCATPTTWPRGVQRVAAESRIFYLLGFYPPEGKAPRQWRNLRVEVKRPGLTVRARRGYTIRSEMASTASAKPRKANGKEPALDPVVARALDSPHAASGIPLRAIAYVLEPRPKGTVHVLVAAEFDAGAVSSGAPETRRLDVSVVALLRDTGRGFQHTDTVALTAAKGDEPRWRAFTREFELPPGVAQVRVVVRDPATGALGSVVQRIEIPSASEFRVSTPILTDRIEPATARGAASRACARGSSRVPCRRAGCTAGTRSSGRRAAVRPPESLRASSCGRRTGWSCRTAAVTPIAPDRDGRLVRLVGVSVEGSAEGAYELVIDVRDEATGVSVLRREAFALARGGR